MPESEGLAWQGRFPKHEGPLPPNKRPRQPTLRAETLMELPNDMLVAIMRKLCGMPNVEGTDACILREPYLGQARDAFCLALCNSRLLRLFRSTFLVRLGGGHGATSDRLLLSRGTFPRSKYQHPRHLHAVAWLSGNFLSEFELPAYGQILYSARHVLAAVADFCPNLKKLSISDSIDTAFELMESVFTAVAPQLQSLSVSCPAHGTFEAFLKVEACTPSYLAFAGVLHHHSLPVWECIRAKGTNLKSFRVDFEDGDSYMSCYSDAETSGPMKLLRFIGKFYGRFLPNLESLALGLSSPTCLTHDYEAGEVREQMDIMKEVSDFLESEDQKQETFAPKLNHICIGGKREHVVNYVKEVGPLLGPHSRLETIFPGGWIAFPPSRMRERCPYFRGIQLFDATLSELDFQRRGMSIFRELECLDFGFKTDVSDFLRADQTSCIRALCEQAGSSLTTLRAKLSFENNRWPTQARALLCSVLALAPSITSLEVSREIVAGMEWFPLPELKSVFSNVESLRLSAPERYFARRSIAGSVMNVRPVDHTRFINCLPAFMIFLEKHCPKLRRIYLDKAGDLSASIRVSDMRRGVLDALAAVNNFESLRENADVSSLRSQLLVWRNQSF